MIKTMYHFNGVGLAAPQIGISKQLFIALEVDTTKRAENQDQDPPQTIAEKRERWGVVNEHVMINPKINKREGIQYGADGCLSIPGLSVDEMKRDKIVDVTYQDLDGQTHSITATDHFAHVIQHEGDHLEGILFFDRLPKEAKEAFMNTHREELLQMQREAKAFLKELKSNPEAYIVTA
jgi:peptide deformylase